MSARELPVMTLLAVVCVALPPVAARVLSAAGAVRANFQGRPVPVGLGVVIAIFSIIAWAVAAWYAPSARGTLSAWTLAIAAFALLGALDDLFGTQEHKGLRGHFRALGHGKVTTGLVKAVVGAATAVGAMILLHKPPVLILSGALLVALAANAMNILDLRPGRAIAASVLLGGTATACAPAAAWPVAAPLAGACACWPLDGRALAMLGDSGSNPLGAAVGLAAASTPLPVQASFLVALCALNAVAERTSITEWIRAHRVAAAIDRLTGVRE